MKIIPIILSGGSGTRLWPISRKTYPKQFLDFFDNNSLFEKTILRFKNDQNFAKPIIVSNHQHRFLIAEKLRKNNFSASAIILEPFARNTAPAITVGVLDAIKNNEDAIICVMPSDHLIKNEKEFLSKLKQAKKACELGFIVTFGIKPEGCETGFGYIEIDQENRVAEDIYAVKRFVEKPNKKKAKEFIDSKTFFWNSGIFMFKAKQYIKILRQINPQIYNLCNLSYQKSQTDLDFIRLDDEEFAKLDNISFDYAIMEKAKKIAIVPIEVSWSDIGSWNAVAKNCPKDHNNNSLIGDVVVINTKDCYVNSKEKLMAVIGVKNLIIISMKDATLIVNKNNAQDVKKMYEILNEMKREECGSHARELRPWGSFEIIDIDRGFKVKRIIVNPRSSLSLQMHNHRAEHWVVVKGCAHITCDEKQFILNEDQSNYIPSKTKHRLENKTDSFLEIIEVQTGSYLAEDDIIRFNDNYGR